MESYKIENLTFSYPNACKNTLENVSFSVEKGEFITVCGKSGCGKTTLLRMLKSSLAPYGELSGEIFFEGTELQKINRREQTEKIGFVLQDPENAIVMDKVWHELAFGAESLGIKTAEIRARVAEISSFFGINEWFHKNVKDLSGGQKQLLCLASVMVMQPSVLIMDEPTSRLDPIAAKNFIDAVERINRELGVTVIISEHRLDDVLPISDLVLVLDSGKTAAVSPPSEIGGVLLRTCPEMYEALPAQIKIFSALEPGTCSPLTVREGRKRLESFAANNPGRIHPELIPEKCGGSVQSEKSTDARGENCAVKLYEVWFRYEKDMPDVLKGLSAEIKRGEIFALVGGNGAGKSTALSVMSGLLKPYRGDVRIFGEKLKNIKSPYRELIGFLPQDPQTLFVEKSVYLDLCDMLEGVDEKERKAKICRAAELCGISGQLSQHPYDLSGGEIQRAALAKVLLGEPKILLLDEPTKGMDAHFKKHFAEILKSLSLCGITSVIVSHDIEFCAEHADRCAMLFDGALTGVDTPRAFFTSERFYTTSVCRMAHTVLPKALIASDVLMACSCPCEHGENFGSDDKNGNCGSESDRGFGGKNEDTAVSAPNNGGNALAFMPFTAEKTKNGLQERQKEVSEQSDKDKKTKRRSAKAVLRILAEIGIPLVLIPLTIILGNKIFDGNYLAISLAVIFETMLPFVFMFEKRRPAARELVIISVLCAVAVAGRAAFYALPQFKPVAALIIIAGVCFGGETGFLVGAMTAFVSNFFFGQGAWTPWQMFAFGIMGLVSGMVFESGLLKKKRLPLCIFGVLATLFIYGGIMNPASVMITYANPSWQLIIGSYLPGLPFDCIHAASTAFFLWVISEPMLSKLERVKTKYGFAKSK